MSKLNEIGHELKVKNLGCRVQAIENKNGQITGVSDPRGEGKAKVFSLKVLVTYKRKILSFDLLIVQFPSSFFFYKKIVIIR